MQNIKFLSLDDVFEIHRLQIDIFGGAYGIRDRGLLESALAVAQFSFEQIICMTQYH